MQKTHLEKAGSWAKPQTGHQSRSHWALVESQEDFTAGHSSGLVGLQQSHLPLQEPRGPGTEQYQHQPGRMEALIYFLCQSWCPIQEQRKESQETGACTLEPEFILLRKLRNVSFLSTPKL